MEIYREVVNNEDVYSGPRPLRGRMLRERRVLELLGAMAPGGCVFVERFIYSASDGAVHVRYVSWKDTKTPDGGRVTIPMRETTSTLPLHIIEMLFPKKPDSPPAPPRPPTMFAGDDA